MSVLCRYHIVLITGSLVVYWTEGMWFSRLFQITAFVLGFKVYQVLQSFFKSGVFVFYSPLALLFKPDILGLVFSAKLWAGELKVGAALENSAMVIILLFVGHLQGVWVLIILKLVSHPPVVPSLHLYLWKVFWNSSGHSHRWLLCKQVRELSSPWKRSQGPPTLPSCHLTSKAFVFNPHLTKPQLNHQSQCSENVFV